MENFGNTCYANSVLQALYFCKPFRQLIESSSAYHPSIPSDRAPQSQPHPPPSHLPTPPTITPSGFRNRKSLPLDSSPSTPNSKNSNRLSTHLRSQSSLAGGSGIPADNPNHHAHDPSSIPAHHPQPPPTPSPAERASPHPNLQLPPTNSNPTPSSLPATNPNILPPLKIDPSMITTTTTTLTPSSSSSLSSASNSNTHHQLNSAPTPGLPTSSSSTIPNPNLKRNWGAADFDQGGVGRHRTLPNSLPPVVSSSTQVTEPSESTLYSSLRDLFRQISDQPNPVGAVAPQAFITTLKRYNELFRSTMHQDAHEFLNYLVNSVAEDVYAEQEKHRLEDEKNASSAERPTPHTKKQVLNLPQPSSTWVHKLFQGILTNETKCLTCETVTQRDESFLDLSIDIHQNTSLTACLRQFSASEMLCQKNKFSCDQCCGLQEAEKRMKIKKLPNVLALHLKRFKYQENLQRYTKLTYRVVFPFELRLFNTTDDIQDPDRLYELWAIVVHIGAGPHHGHYITILKSHGQWLLFDDNVVTRIEERDIQKYYGDTPGVGSGYVLFYQATDLDLIDLMGVPQDLNVVDQEPAVLADGDEMIIPKTDDDASLSTFNVKPTVEVSQLSTWNGFQPLTSESTKAKLSKLAKVDIHHRKDSVPTSLLSLSSSTSKITSAASTPQSSAPIKSPSRTSRAHSMNARISGFRGGSSPNGHVASNQISLQRELSKPSTSPRLGSIGTSRIAKFPLNPIVMPPLSDSILQSPTNKNFSAHSSEAGLLSPLQPAPPLPKSPLTINSVSRLTSKATRPQTPEDRLGSGFNCLPTSPLQNSLTASSSPNLHRKFSAKFLRRKKSSVSPPIRLSMGPSSPSTHSVPGLGTESGSVGSLGIANEQKPTQNQSSHDHRFVFSSSFGLDSADHTSSPQRANLSSSYRHSLAATLDVSHASHRSQASSLPSSNRSSIHSSYPSTSTHQITGSGSTYEVPTAGQPTFNLLLMTAKGAQAPPAVFSLNQKQQRDIRKATEKASKLAEKEMVKALKERNKQYEKQAKQLRRSQSKDHPKLPSESDGNLISSHSNHHQIPSRRPIGIGSEYRNLVRTGSVSHSATDYTDSSPVGVGEPSSSPHDRKTTGQIRNVVVDGDVGSRHRGQDHDSPNHQAPGSGISNPRGLLARSQSSSHQYHHPTGLDPPSSSSHHPVSLPAPPDVLATSSSARFMGGSNPLSTSFSNFLHKTHHSQDRK